eukprot:g2944.t1
MAGVSGGLLASTTTNAHACGLIAGGYLDNLEKLNKEIQIYRSNTMEGTPVHIGFIGYAAMKDGLERVESVLKQHQPFSVQFFAPAHTPNGTFQNFELARKYNCKIIAQVGCEKDAIDCLEAGVDCLVAQGTEAGGHGLHSELGSGTLPFSRRCVELADQISSHTSVLAAGGITDGKGLAAALSLGCDGAVFGTRLWASKEALGHVKLKSMLNDATCDDIIRTNVFDKIIGATSPNPWEYPFDSVGCIHNETSKKYHGKEDVELDNDLKEVGDNNLLNIYKTAVENGNGDICGVWAGEGVGMITNYNISANEIIKTAEIECLEQIEKLKSMVKVSVVNNKYMHEGKQVVRITGCGEMRSGFGSKIIYADGTTKESSRYDAFDDLIEEFDFVVYKRMQTDRYHGGPSFEAVPKEDPGEWEEFGEKPINRMTSTQYGWRRKGCGHT